MRSYQRKFKHYFQATKKDFICNTYFIMIRGKNNGLYKNVPFNSEQWIKNIYKRQNENWICIMTNEAPVAAPELPV